MGILIRALASYFACLPYAIGAGALVALVTWVVWREQRRRLQFVLTAAAFGGGFLIGLYPLLAGTAYIIGLAQPLIIGGVASAAALAIMVGAGFIVERRLFMPAVLLGLSYMIVLVMLTVPMSALRG